MTMAWESFKKRKAQYHVSVDQDFGFKKKKDFGF